MLDDNELEALMVAESDRVEWKSSAADPEKLQETICAFANDLPGHDLPGVLFIGLNPDGACANLLVDDALLTRLSQLRDDGRILPLPELTVQQRQLRGCTLAVVTVSPSRSLPVRFRGRVCVRVGARRATASADEERRLVERHRAFDLPFDAREASSATLDDLDVDYVRSEYLPAAIASDVLAANERSIEHQLRSVHFTGPNGRPTHAGLLVAGVDPLTWMPGAYVQFVRFDGTQLTDGVRDDKVLSGRLADVLRRVDDVCQANNAVQVSFVSTATEERRSEYPLAALQQLTRNAVMHRNYEGTNAPTRVYWFDDRIEIHSPGGPFGHVSRENFGQPFASDYRNPHVAESMRNLGFVQRFGVGIATAQREMMKSGNPPVEFDVQPSAVLATVRRRP